LHACGIVFVVTRARNNAREVLSAAAAVGGAFDIVLRALRALQALNSMTASPHTSKAVLCVAVLAGVV